MKPYIKVMLVDDESEVLDTLAVLLETDPRLEIVSTETDSMRALKFMRMNPIDILITDVQMKNLNGLDLVRSLRPRPAVILITGYDEYAIQAYELGVQDCVPKPLELARLLLAIDRAVQYRWGLAGHESEGKEYVFVKELNETVNSKIYFDDLILIESDKNNLKLLLSGNEEVTTRMTISEMINILPQKDFVQTHKGFIVNVNKVTKYDLKTNKVYLAGTKRKINISATYYEMFLAKLGT